MCPIYGDWYIDAIDAELMDKEVRRSVDHEAVRIMEMPNLLTESNPSYAREKPSMC